MDDAQTTISALLPDTPLAFLPSPWQYDRTKDAVDWEAGSDPDGNFLGHCVMHDANREHEHSAVFNFDRGVIRCQADPSCHPGKRAMSLINALKKAALTDEG